MKLEEKLVYLRKQKGLTQMKLAEMMDVSRQAISRWETGAATPSSENLKYLGSLYDVSLDYLFDESTDEPEHNKGIKDKPEPEGETTSVPVSVNDEKKDRRKVAKWGIIALGLLALLVTIYISVIDSDEGNFVSISDIQRKEVASKEGVKFELESVNWR